jgi:lysophospholipase L1-like esterase
MIRKSLVFLLMLSSTAGLVRAATIIDPMNPDILYTGRWDFSSPNRPWAQAKASSVIVNFQGTSIAVDIEGNTSDYLRVIIDDNALGSSKLQLQNGLITLAYGLSDTTHKLELYKENDNGRLYLNSIHLDEGKNLASPPARPRHKIEFYGDSNQAGYSLESERNQGGSHLQGAYYTYPGIVARMFNAEHVNFSKSGATISSLNTAFDRTDWNSSSPAWSFDDFPAELVVVNIGANDSGPDRRKKSSYHDLLDDLRLAHPTAHIMLYNAYGWDFREPANFIHEVIAERSENNMSWAVFPWVFAQYHGCEYDHGGMAMVLAEHIETVMG